MYSFYLDNVLLPITPKQLQIKIKNQNKTIELINFGQVNILKTPGLSEINFDFSVPIVGKYPFARELQSPQYYFSVLENLKTQLKPFKFTVLRQISANKSEFATSMMVTLEDYEIVEDADNGFDVTFKINLKQYREYSTQTVEVKQNSDGSLTSTKQTPRQTTKTPAKTYTVKSGDTLWNIAKKQLGDGSKYKDLATLNNISNPNFLTVGQVLKLS